MQTTLVLVRQTLSHFLTFFWSLEKFDIFISFWPKLGYFVFSLKASSVLCNLTEIAGSIDCSVSILSSGQTARAEMSQRWPFLRKCRNRRRKWLHSGLLWQSLSQWCVHQRQSFCDLQRQQRLCRHWKQRQCWPRKSRRLCRWSCRCQLIETTRRVHQMGRKTSSWKKVKLKYKSLACLLTQISPTYYF